ncbi:peptidase M20 family protein (homolog to carboxypeptidase) [Natronomonas moolapensis 8.8.11]|uniref:Peptidase M20 family protein (Homolog to carboxypeptidase) n=1 Tax=Natronomonas moolapensis (strain DSM 18674 / CECT 7526 / JCM 14361 / 8.8.11) TaxID=268739 RepID=M1Y4N0_NATM8|nr:M20 family metallopeptidase [Natronomonas moolapensis]CCQ37483.1 peptidase M20 family protein (homolog to carboxypeptidase) [Natronomonas moolapensis 8.8.11]
MTPADGTDADETNRDETADGTGTGTGDGGGTDADGDARTPGGPDAAPERRIREWAGDNRDRVEAYLLELVEAETPTENPETFDPLFERLAGDFEAVGLETERVPGKETGGRLEAYSPGSKDGPIQLVLGHADTVWPLGTVAEHPPEVRADVLEGPGSLDMKGGLTQAVFALRALDALSLDPGLPVHVLVSSDEEIGSPESKPRIVELAKRAARVFVLEPASGPEGKIKTARKAVGHFTVTIEGKAAHAGLEPEAGASATEELGTVIHRLHGLTDVDSGVTVNVGEVEAGLRSNVVAPEARAEVDVRAPTETAADAVSEQIRSLEATTPGTELRIDGGFGRPPMERTPGNRLLWERVQAIGRRLDLDLEGTRSGGASDGNDASQHAPTIDGFGAVGDGAHQAFEYVRLDALVDRVALLAACLCTGPLEAGDGA